jgi:two-component system cell cycle sensor histidine kinase PleC
MTVSALALMPSSDGIAGLAGLMPSSHAIAVGLLVFFSCASGILLVHGEMRLGGGCGSIAGDIERLIADRTRALSERVRELEAARAAAVEANAAKSRFLATMSHELRTPLNAILGFSEIIEREIYGNAGDRRYPEYARHIHDSGEHLLSLIGDVLDLSKIEAGKMELHREPLCVRELIGEVRRLSNADQSHALAVRVGDALPRLDADHRAAKQMLLNLLSNAMKFTPAGGSIVVDVTLRDDEGLTIAVRDSGIGIAKEDIPKALAAYSQVPNDETRRHDGTGLGLPIVNALMRLHGGSLELESEVGVGTTVSLHFPAAAPVAAAV